MEKVNLKAELREGTGKGTARELRRKGKIPAIIYKGGKSTPLMIDRKDILSILSSRAGEHALINLQIGGGKEKIAIIRDYQLDPVKGDILHADFFEISLKEKIKMTIPVFIVGKEPVGVKSKGGILQHIMRDVEIEGLPTMIPERLEVDASNLDVGDSIRVSDLAVKEGLRVLADVDEVIVSIVPPISEGKLEEILTAAAAPPEMKEPELVKKPKEVEEKVEE
jgi:large subunit ribosomal protein L25